MNMWFNLGAVVLLLAANAFFVAAEFALVKARAFRIDQMANDGSGAARLTRKIMNNLEAYLAACQLGITMASLGLGWVGEPAVAALLEPVFHALGLPENLLHTVSFITGFLVFSSLHIVIGEQVPKTFAIRKPEQVAVLSSYLLWAAYLAVWPLNWALNKASSGLLSLFGVAEASHHEVYSTDELKGMVATSGAHGEIQQDRAAMLKNIFEFDERLVGRVMIPRGSAAMLDVAGTPDENLAVIRDEPHSRFPLIDSDEDDKILGLVLVKDIHKALLNGQKTPWHDLREFVREPMIVPETQRISDLFELMRSRRAHMAFVVDEYGVFVGVVTLEDLLEEIVGEIQDETDDESPDLGIYKKEDGTWEADGLASLGDVEREIGLKIPADLDANTLSGLFLQRLARMPQVGDEIVEQDHRLKVLNLADRHVARVQITHITDDEAAAGDAGAH